MVISFFRNNWKIVIEFTSKTNEYNFDLTLKTNLMGGDLSPETIL